MIQNIWLKTKNADSTESRKISFPKETVENAGLHKVVLNKTMTIQEQRLKYNFVAPWSAIGEQAIVKKKITCF